MGPTIIIPIYGKVNLPARPNVEVPKIPNVNKIKPFKRNNNQTAEDTDAIIYFVCLLKPSNWSKRRKTRSTQNKREVRRALKPFPPLLNKLSITSWIIEIMSIEPEKKRLGKNLVSFFLFFFIFGDLGFVLFWCLVFTTQKEFDFLELKSFNCRFFFFYFWCWYFPDIETQRKVMSDFPGKIVKFALLFFLR